MPILTIIFIIALILLAFYLINTYIKDETLKKWFNIALVIIVVLWLLKIAGFLTFLSNLTV